MYELLKLLVCFLKRAYLWQQFLALLAGALLCLPSGSNIEKTLIDPSSAESANVTTSKFLYGKTQRIADLPDDEELWRLIDELLTAALGQNKKYDTLVKKIARFQAPTNKTVTRLTDATQYALQYKGFKPSMQAADVILGEEIEVDSGASAAYARQRLVDQLHASIVGDVLQIAMGLGLSNQEHSVEVVNSGYTSLAELVGDKQARLAVDELTSWSSNCPPLYSTFSQEAWDIHSFRDKVTIIVGQAMSADPVMSELLKYVRKYEHVSRISEITSRVVEIALNGLSYFGPGYAIPASADAANILFNMITGGTEESKLLKELYFDKRLESRWRTLNEEAQLALFSYQLAVTQHNAPLLLASEAIIAGLVGADNVPKILYHTELAHNHTSMHRIDKTLIMANPAAKDTCNK